MKKNKQIFVLLLACLAIFLMTLPFVVSFNEVLTKIVERFELYMWVQERIVPMEIRMVGVLVKPLNIDFSAHPGGMSVNGIYAGMTWNCVGWQSLLLLIVTLVVGLKGKYVWWTKLEAMSIGLLGTFLMNLLRMTITVVILAVSRPLFAVVFHDYLAAFMTVLWLMLYWWFCYSFVLRLEEETVQYDD